MIEQRLLTTDRNDEGQVTVEPAHEALLRQWGLLKGWLEEDLAALAALEASQRATRDWLANDKAKDWLNHSAGRLEEAEAVAAREDLNGFLANDEHDYLRRCRKAHDARTQKELENAKALALAQARAAAHTRVGMVVVWCWRRGPAWWAGRRIDRRRLLRSSGDVPNSRPRLRNANLKRRITTWTLP